jgi:hypothetical protein
LLRRIWQAARNGRSGDDDTDGRGAVDTAEFEYMGKKVKIDVSAAGDKGTVTVDRKKFKIHQHTEGGEDDNFIKLWMCHDSYLMTETPEQLARHIVRYWHQYQDA